MKKTAKVPIYARKMAREGAMVVILSMSSNRDSPMAMLITEGREWWGWGRERWGKGHGSGGGGAGSGGGRGMGVVGEGQGSGMGGAGK